MKNLSPIAVGILGAVGLPLLVQWGFTDSCANEVVDKLAPVVSSLPGLIWAWLSAKKANVMSLGGKKI